MITLSELLSSANVVNDLDWPFDFALHREAIEEAGPIQLKPSHPFTVIAGEGTGGVFLAYGIGAVETLPLLHGTSEGQSGRVASNLAQWLAILMAVPYWRDVLKFSGGGQLDHMRAAALLMESEYAEDYPELPDARQRLIDTLAIPLLDDPIKALHDNVHATDCVLLSHDGCEYESLFGTFKPADNPGWR